MNLKIIKRDSNIVGIRVTHRYLDSETNSYKTFDFEFRDSYLTLNFSPLFIKKRIELAESFGTPLPYPLCGPTLWTHFVDPLCGPTLWTGGKGIFPYGFAKNDINLNYVGKVPEFKYFENISLDEYNEYSDNFKNKKKDIINNFKKRIKRIQRRCHVRVVNVEYC